MSHSSTPPDSGIVDLVSAKEERPDGPVGGSSKRIFDLSFAIGSLIILAPLMIIIYFILKISEGGPALYSHRRVGRGGNQFGCHKFRTMAMNSADILQELLERDPEAAREWAETQKLRNDPRISRFGRLLRRTSLDELPQLFNILKGEMSLVGPRPVTETELDRYGAAAEIYKRARPGLTGQWQVNRTEQTTYDMRVRYDVEYVMNQSMTGDVRIIASTFKAVMSGEGAY